MGGAFAMHGSVREGIPKVNSDASSAASIARVEHATMTVRRTLLISRQRCRKTKSWLDRLGFVEVSGLNKFRFGNNRIVAKIHELNCARLGSGNDLSGFGEYIWIKFRFEGDQPNSSTQDPSIFPSLGQRDVSEPARALARACDPRLFSSRAKTGLPYEVAIRWVDHQFPNADS